VSPITVLLNVKFVLWTATAKQHVVSPGQEDCQANASEPRILWRRPRSSIKQIFVAPLPVHGLTR
jgi:hypothetical protein